MAIAWAASNVGKSGSSPLTIAVNIPSIENAIVVGAGLVTGSAGTPGSVAITFDGNAMTNLYAGVDGTYYYTLMAYRKLGTPATGSKNLVVSWAGICAGCFLVAILSGVDQITSIGSLANGNSSSLNVPCAAGDFIIDLVNGYGDVAPSNPGAQQTQRMAQYLNPGGGGTNWGNTGSSTIPADADPETFTWTSATCIRHIAMPFKPYLGGLKARIVNPFVGL